MLTLTDFVVSRVIQDYFDVDRPVLDEAIDVVILSYSYVLV